MATKKHTEGNPANIINAGAVAPGDPNMPAPSGKSVKLHHPTFADVSTEVAAADVDAWTAQHWRKTPLPK